VRRRGLAFQKGGTGLFRKPDKAQFPIKLPIGMRGKRFLRRIMPKPSRPRPRSEIAELTAGARSSPKPRIRRKSAIKKVVFPRPFLPTNPASSVSMEKLAFSKTLS
jgi:hypothetical protein